MKSKHSNLIFILPNLFTAASVFCGVFSMTSALNAEFDKAAWLIFLSLILDGLDGRIARITNTCSRFGIEFDSLADIVAFGVAPAILMYLFVGNEFGRFGVVVSALFVIFGAVRLARFNVMTSSVEPSVFIGVPIPVAAVFIALLILLFEKYGIAKQYGVFIMLSAVMVSFLMVSNIRYPSFKKIQLSQKHILKLFVVILFVLMGLFMYPTEGITIAITLYLLYGAIRTLILFLKHLNIF